MKNRLSSYYNQYPYDIDVKATFEKNKEKILDYIDTFSYRDLRRFKMALVNAIILQKGGSSNRFVRGLLTNLSEDRYDLQIDVIYHMYPSRVPNRCIKYVLDRECGYVY
jgi:hypothetical protein